MVLTYRSTIPETITLVQQDTDGRVHKGTAVRRSDKDFWALRDEIPDGQKFERSFNGDKNEAAVALAMHMAQHRTQFNEAKHRGDRPAQRMRHDYNVSLGAETPIVYSERDNRRR